MIITLVIKIWNKKWINWIRHSADVPIIVTHKFNDGHKWY